MLRRAGRDRAGRFLVEGAQAVREALAHGRVHELFATVQAAARHPELVEAAGRVGARLSPVTDRAAESLSETITPQGLVAVCDVLDVDVAAALGERPRLVAVCVGIADPGNAGTIVRVADAAGADAVLLAGDTVDPHNGKAVRASTGSVFHLPLARDRDTGAVLDACRAAGLTLLVADGHGELDLHEPAADRGAGRAGRVDLRRRGARSARAGRRGRRPPRPRPDPRAGGEPQPGHGRRDLPLRVGRCPPPALIEAAARGR